MIKLLISISEIIGRFHPVLVHLPIGFLLLALVLQWLSNKPKYMTIKPAVQVAYLLGFAGALFSCITGLCLASGGEYDESTLDLHKWVGISVAVVSLIGYLFQRFAVIKTAKTITAICLFVLVSVTGHLGGTLTHGEGYLTQSFTQSANDTTALRKPIANVQEAVAYHDIIQPILQEKCTKCHGANKQKGKLRLDGQEWIVKGGKNGEVVQANNPGESELYQRLLLDMNDEHHMPPKGKPQLTEQELTLMHWWISNGYSFEKKVKDIEQKEIEKKALLALQSSGKEEKRQIKLPSAEVEPALQKDIAALQQKGVIVLPVAANSNYLSANFVSLQKIDDSIIALLQPLKKQLVWLKLRGAVLSNASLSTLSSLTNITRLNIEHSSISDSGLVFLKSLVQLQYLNLVATHISAKGVEQLKGLQQLKNIYLAQTLVAKNDWAVLQKQFPKTVFDSGGYKLPFLASDTVVIKAPPAK